jgi:hypothetical protein
MLIIILAMLIGAAGYAIANRQSNAATTPQQNKPSPTDTTRPKEGETVTVTGKAICLELREPKDVQTLMCATGFLADNGTAYAMTADDPTLSGGIPTGEPYEITGTLTPSAEGISHYRQDGTIHVTSARQVTQ